MSVIMDALFTDVGALKAENLRLKRLNNQLTGALKMIGKNVCENCECEEIISILTEQGLLIEGDGIGGDIN